jgi:hypothetical protein
MNMDGHRFESADDLAASSWWTLLKVPDHRDQKKIRDVVSPWGTGFLAKSTTLMFIHVNTARALGRAQGPGTRDRCPGMSSLRICVWLRGMSVVDFAKGPGSSGFYS